MTQTSSDRIGPILFLHGAEPHRMTLAAVVIQPAAADAPPQFTCRDAAHDWVRLAEVAGMALWRVRFQVTYDRAHHYDFDGTRYDLGLPGRGDMRLAYVSCNGEEHGDLDRDPRERNAMWAKLRQQHDQSPYALLLHGGDQVYADEVTDGHPLSDNWPDDVPDSATEEALQGLRDHLRAGFMQRYLMLYRDPDIAWLMARVPSLAMWDDHDICDGWGSLLRRATFSDVGQTLFTCAREAFLLFQCGATDSDVPDICLDPGGTSLGRALRLPGMTILMPDLRSERGRRQVMGTAGWRDFEAQIRQGLPARTFLMSSVPLLGPRLSVLEALMVIAPGMQKYEDDLRDQWQSRAHRSEWRRMLREVLRVHDAPGSDLTVLSGEIHLATRATMRTKGNVLHQLVASGIAHRAPPKAWARILGALAIFGEGPLPGHRITIRPLPGQRNRYTAERNYLVLTRSGADWSAHWELEDSGPTPALPI